MISQKHGIVPILALLLGIAPAALAEPLPASIFAREEAYNDVRISPDGEFIGFVGTVGAEGLHHVIFFLNLASGKVATAESPVNAYDAEGGTEARHFWWLTGTRALFSFEQGSESRATGYLSWAAGNYNWGGLAAVGRDGKNWHEMWGAKLFFIPPNSSHVLLLGYDPDELNRRAIVDEDTGFDFAKGSEGTDLRAPPVDARPNIVANYAHEMENWITDRNGDIRMGVGFDGAHTRVYFRERTDTPWAEVPDLGFAGWGTLPVAIDWDRRTAYVDTLTRSGTWGLSTYDLATMKMGALVASDPNYDIDNPAGSSCDMLFSSKKRRLVGIRYQARTYRTLWLDPEMAAIQASVDHALPGAVNLVLNWSDDESRMIVGSFTDLHPTSYYLLDRKARRFRKLFDAADWINPDQMSRTFPMSFRARDGLLVHGFVTFPQGSVQKNLPTIVVMNPDFGAMGATPEYDSFIQYLASRGYAVLRINPRGTPGYGKAFYDAGRRQQGGTVQDDITDGVRWAVAKGIANPGRVGVYGSRLGGFSVGWALAHEPSLYRCGVANEGLFDWKPIMEYYNAGPSFIKRAGHSYNAKWINYLNSEMGDSGKDGPTVSDLSPINRVDRIKAPVLIISRKRDYLDEMDQSKEFASALESHGVAHEFKVFPKTSNTAETRKQREEYYTLVGSFFDKNLK